MPILNLFITICLVLSTSAICMASEEQFNSDKMLVELEKQMNLSQEKLEKLKPAIDKKSAELKKTIHESVDQGFVQFEEAGKKLNAVSKETEEKVHDAINSEEMKQLKDYLNKIDQSAIQETKDQLVSQLTSLLELTEEQVGSLKPVLEDGIQQLGEMLNKLAKEGNANLEEFKREYKSLSTEIRTRIEKQLDGSQLKKLEKYNEDRKEKIQNALFTN